MRRALAAPVVGAAIATVWAGSDRAYRGTIRRKYPELEVPEDAKVISGHFVADQFDTLLSDRDREPVRGIMLREPLDRMISHYNYWSRDRGGDDWRVLVPFKRMRRGQAFQQYFEEFAMLPELQNHQASAMGDLDLAQFDVVGVTEHLGEFTEAFLRRLAQEGLTVSGQKRDFPTFHLNSNHVKRRIRRSDLSDEFKASFREHHARDYELYEQAKDIQEKRMEESGVLQ